MKPVVFRPCGLSLVATCSIVFFILQLCCFSLQVRTCHKCRGFQWPSDNHALCFPCSVCSSTRTCDKCATWREQQWSQLWSFYGRESRPSSSREPPSPSTHGHVAEIPLPAPAPDRLPVPHRRAVSDIVELSSRRAQPTSFGLSGSKPRSPPAQKYGRRRLVSTSPHPPQLEYAAGVRGPLLTLGDGKVSGQKTIHNIGCALSRTSLVP